MVRRLTAVAAGVGVMLVGSLAHAQASGGSFGQQGEFIFSADRLLPVVGYTRASANQLTGIAAPISKIVQTQNSSSLGFFWGGTDAITSDTGAVIPNPYTVPRLGFDYTILPNVTVGGDVILFFTLGGSTSTETDLNSGSSTTTTTPAPKSTIFGIAPRGGYILHLNDLLSVWLRGGFSFYTMTVKSTDPGGTGATDSVNYNQFALDLDPQLVITPLPHFGFTAGVTGDIPIAGGHAETHTDGGGSTSASASSSLLFVGVTGGLVGWF